MLSRVCIDKKMKISVCKKIKEEKNRREGRSFLLELAHDDIVQDDLSYGL